MTERISALYVSQGDVRRGNVDIKPLEFVPVSDGRKLRKEKRPLPSSPPSAPIDFVRRLFRSWAWISEFRIRCCSSEGAEEGEIFDHNSSTKGRKNSFLLFFLFLFTDIGNDHLVESTEETILSDLMYDSYHFQPSFRKVEHRFPRRNVIIFVFFSNIFLYFRVVRRLVLGTIRNWIEKIFGVFQTSFYFFVLFDDRLELEIELMGKIWNSS